MTPEQLKSSILLAALQGKVVEQREEEGTGEALYHKIQAEKSELISEKVLKKMELEVIDENEVPFDIPATWKWVRHNDLFEIVGGSQPPKSNFKDTPSDGDVRLYQIRDYGESPVPVYVDKKLVSKFTEEGDILLARYGGSIGKVFWAKTGAYNVAMAKIVMLYKTELVDRKFLYYYYLAPLYQNLVKGSNRAAQGGFNKEDLNVLLFPLPPLEEQHRIVNKIEEILPYIDQYESSYEKLERFNAKFPDDMKKSILQYAMQGKLVEQSTEDGTADELYEEIQQANRKKGIKKNKKLLEVTEDDYLFDIPDTWKWVRIGDIFETSSGTTPSKSNLDYYNSGDYNWVRTTDLNNGILTSGEVKISQKAKDECKLDLIPFDSVCVAMYGGAGTIGKNALIRFETTINQSVCAIHPNGYCDMEYLLYYMHFFRPLWMNYAAGSRKDPNINQIVINNAIFALPPRNEQIRIVKKLDEILEKCKIFKEVNQ